MIDPTLGNLSGIGGMGGVGGALPGAGNAAAPAGGSKFAEMLQKNIDEVSRLQQDASQAVDDLATGKSDNVTGVMTAVEKSDLAFKTLLAIRSKLMDAYEEIKGISV
jgi:flagellar hook-basal body complex protein FliE